MYHVIANLEDRFFSLHAAEGYCDKPFALRPKLPETADVQGGEDNTTPRICVAPTIEQCITAIGIDRFRRCCAGNDDAKSYETYGREVYPIIVMSFSDAENYYCPSPALVPDIKKTDEQWLLYPCSPRTATLYWLTMRSVTTDEKDYARCTRVKLLKDPPWWGVHPWLTGCGHKLESSDDEGEHNDGLPHRAVCEQRKGPPKSYAEKLPKLRKRYRTKPVGYERKLSFDTVKGNGQWWK